MLNSANQAEAMYPGLSHGAYECVCARCGTEEQKALFLPKQVTGEWAGTVCLTEPHCGTDLGVLRTKAEPQPDGTYRLTGQKIFISAGEHDLAPTSACWLRRHCLRYGMVTMCVGMGQGAAGIFERV